MTVQGCVVVDLQEPIAHRDLAGVRRLELSTMTVTVTLPDGATDKYMRFYDAFIKHDDGTLDVVRGGPDSRTATRRGSGPKG